MEIGLFYAYQLPDTTPSEGFEWDLQTARWADGYGLTEAWFSEHYTVGYERWCSPELQIAAVARETTSLRLGTGANLIPYHHPVALAYRLMMLDHMTKGRLMVGFGAGGFSTDAHLFGTQMPAQNHEMLEEGQQLIRQIWANEGEALKVAGKHFSVDIPALEQPLHLGSHWRPYQPGGPRVAVAGFTPASSTIREGGARGDIPMSIAFTNEYLASHWAAYCEGAARTGVTPNREDWRIVRDVVVADTDEAAWELAYSEPYRRVYEEWVIPHNMPMLLKMMPGVRPEDITFEAFSQGWIVGSPETVTEALVAEQQLTGGFGKLLVHNMDFHREPDGYRRHLELLGTVVAPAVTERTAALFAAK
ncbi:putative luciferase-like monooxygenase [Actinoplanes missouriensis 431]|uniref:Putative luciferase-like monooxygenase n=1 Tax=Actinoplanes missouriensis (strain ATCC 14538 / DSM 43046 / CBS 188.64 / JCM 3121 / NBRC 102363 / NCIMB 12654 / NRRL B-3342 / UNCC 431) TaxID=512565 RepID=I0H4K9_ACTM4|nr:LLM class flavin-dependent oxidoreductase [Actinoplanes missouriensis]BAL87946.1 putative luciferase-like monooxygenase [Actinoplanes missouriensis 431]